MTHTTFTLCRDMIRQLTYGASCNMIGIATMARFTVTSDTRVSEVRCVLECADIDVSGRVTDRTILNRWYVVNYLAGSDVTVMTRFAVI